MRNFKVRGVHTQLGSQGENLCGCASTVRNWNANFNYVEQITDPSWQIGARYTSSLQTLLEFIGSAFVHDYSHGLQTTDHSVECANDCLAILLAYIKPNCRVPRCHTRHVTEPTCSQAQYRNVLFSVIICQRHQRCCSEMRQMAHNGNELVVTFCAEHDEFGT